MEIPSVFKMHVGSLYNSHMPPHSVWRLKRCPQDATGHYYTEPIRIRGNELKNKKKKVGLVESNLISKCCKGTQLYSQNSKTEECSWSMSKFWCLFMKRNNFPMKKSPHQAFLKHRESRMWAVHSILGNMWKMKVRTKEVQSQLNHQQCFALQFSVSYVCLQNLWQSILEKRAMNASWYLGD